MKRLIIAQTVSMIAVSSWINPQAAVRSIIVGMRHKLVTAVFEETGDAKADWGKFNTSISVRVVDMNPKNIVPLVPPMTLLEFKMWVSPESLVMKREPHA